MATTLFAPVRVGPPLRHEQRPEGAPTGRHLFD
jgi:hypothetical protein